MAGREDVRDGWREWAERCHKRQAAAEKVVGREKPSAQRRSETPSGFEARVERGREDSRISARFALFVRDANRSWWLDSVDNL